MDYQLKINGVKELVKKLEGATKQEVIDKGLSDSGNFFQSTVVKTRLRGPRPEILGRVTGRLSSSIFVSPPEHEGQNTIVSIGTNVEYARIHEYGGVIRPRNGNFLRFKTRDGKWHSVKQVTMPARPFFKPVMESAFVQDRIINIMTDRINKALEK